MMGQFVYIDAKVCRVLLHYISFATRRQKCVQENWPYTKKGPNCKNSENKRFYNAVLLDKFKQRESSQ